MEQAFERRPWLVPLTLALLTIVFLRPALIPPGPGQALDGKDLQSMFYPLQEYIRQTLLSGELPLWNPHQFIGHPIVGNPHAALFYPATWFIWLVGVVRGMNWSLVFHTWLAAWGMARLARGVGSSYTGSLLAGIIYAMSGWAGAHYFAGHYNLMTVMAWIPWIVVAYRHALARGTWRATLPGMAALGLAILAGYPPLLIYAAFCLAWLWIYRVALADSPIREGWYSARLLLIMGLGGAVLGTALLLPTLELTSLSVRSSADPGFANTYAMPPAQLITLVVPGFFGDPKVGPYYYWGMDFFEEFTAYAGLLPLLAIPLAFRWRLPKHGDRAFFLGLVVLGLVLCVGLEGALMPILVRWIPGFASFRTPARALLLTVIGLAGLAAQLVTALQTSTPEERREALRPAVRVWLPAAALIAFLGALFFSGWFSSASHVEPMPLRAFTDSGMLAMAGLILVGVWFVCWFWSQDDPKLSRYALLLTCILVTLDAWHVATPIITFGDVREPPLWQGARSNIPVGPDARLIASTGFENLASVTGHLNIAGYDPLPIDTYQKLFALGDAADPLTPSHTLLGVKYLMAPTPVDKTPLKLIGTAPGGIYYQRSDPFPRAWIAQDVTVEPNDDAVRQKIVSGEENSPKTTILDRAIDCPSGGGGIGIASITTYGPNDVTIVTSGGSGVLTLSDQFYPGWQATVDGQSTPIVRADTAFRAVCLPSGDHVVQFTYRPLSFFVGIAVSAAGWLALLIVTLLTVGRRRTHLAL